MVVTEVIGKATKLNVSYLKDHTVGTIFIQEIKPQSRRLNLIHHVAIHM